jgi:RNA polymerase sigma-70 factor (ECF subfamily)
MGRTYPLLDHDPREVPSLKSPTSIRQPFLGEKSAAEDARLPVERLKSQGKRLEAAVRELDPDEELLAQCRAGSKRAFNLLVLRHKDRLYTLALLLLRDRSEAEEVALEAFVRAYERLGELREGMRFSSWLSCLCYDLHLTRQSKERDAPHDRREPGAEALPKVFSDSVSRFLGQMVRKPQSVLPQVLRCLDAEIHEVVALSYVGQLSYEQMAHLLDLPVDTVRSRFHRGREELKELLRPYFMEE